MLLSRSFCVRTTMPAVWYWCSLRTSRFQSIVATFEMGISGFPIPRITEIHGCRASSLQLHTMPCPFACLDSPRGWYYFILVISLLKSLERAVYAPFLPVCLPPQSRQQQQRFLFADLRAALRLRWMTTSQGFSIMGFCSSNSSSKFWRSQASPTTIILRP
eukprot:m.638742 g.638742  ORF g.638742 m.638742 type:complete len:161 (-) comp58328_c0_seq29:1753-2235(-)